jgi:hypothetical protein
MGRHDSLFKPKSSFMSMSLETQSWPLLFIMLNSTFSLSNIMAINSNPSILNWGPTSTAWKNFPCGSLG